MHDFILINEKPIKIENNIPDNLEVKDIKLNELNILYLILGSIKYINNRLFIINFIKIFCMVVFLSFVTYAIVFQILMYFNIVVNPMIIYIFIKSVVQFIIIELMMICKKEISIEDFNLNDYV